MLEGCEVLRDSWSLRWGCEVAKLTTNSRGEFQCSTFNQSIRKLEFLRAWYGTIQCLRIPQSLYSGRKFNYCRSWGRSRSASLRILQLVSLCSTFDHRLQCSSALSTFVITQYSTRSVKESRPEPSIVTIVDCYNRGLLQLSAFEICKLEDIAVSLARSTMLSTMISSSTAS